MKILYRSEKPCRECGKKEKNVFVADGEERLSLCMDHAYNLIPEKKAKAVTEKGPMPKEPAKS